MHKTQNTRILCKGPSQRRHPAKLECINLHRNICVPPGPSSFSCGWIECRPRYTKQSHLLPLINCCYIASCTHHLIHTLAQSIDIYIDQNPLSTDCQYQLRTYPNHIANARRCNSTDDKRAGAAKAQCKLTRWKNDENQTSSPRLSL